MKQIKQSKKTRDVVVDGSVRSQALTLEEVGLRNVRGTYDINYSVGFSVWVRALLQNWRQGTVGCKGRSDVNRSNKKPFKQKGTGRARAGSARSPLWRGGGVIFGPQPRTRTLAVSKKVKSSVLRSLFADRAAKGHLYSVDLSFGESPRTSMVSAVLKANGWVDKKVAVLLPWENLIARASFSNIANVQVLGLDALNAYDVANCDVIVMLKQDVLLFKEMVSQWT